jgi:hypothetical protein
MAEQEEQGAQKEGHGEEAEMMARLQEEIANLPVAEHLVYMLHSLSALAVSRLGLSSETKERRDLVQAQLAIDAFKAVLGVLEPVRPAGEVSAHRGMLSQLQLAYAGAMGQARATSESGEEPPPPSMSAAAEGEKASTGPEKASTGPKKTPATGKKAPSRVKKAPATSKKAPGSGGSVRNGS